MRANAVLPGWTMTPMAEGVLTWDRFRDRVLPRMPVGRWGQPDDFGAVAVYLASPASAFHTADTLLLDGGYSAFWRATPPAGRPHRTVTSAPHAGPRRRTVPQVPPAVPTPEAPMPDSPPPPPT